MQPVTRKSVLLAAVLLPLVPAAPAHAADNVICVNTADPSCGQTAPTIIAALTAANLSPTLDTVLVGPGEYSDGPYTLNASVEDITLRGSGEETVLTLPASATQQTYVAAFEGAVVEDLTIDMEGAQSLGDSGLVLGSGARAEQVSVVGETVADATGVRASNGHLVGSTVSMPLVNDNRGIYGEGGNTITDTVLSGSPAIAISSDPGEVDTISRSTILGGAVGGVTVDSGGVAIDNTVVDLGTSNGTGVRLANFNNSVTPREAVLDHVTVVGGGDSSRGVWAYAAVATARQTSTIELTNSILHGPATDLVADAGNNGSQGGDSLARIDVSFSDYHTSGGTVGANGTGGVVAGSGNLDVDPGFIATDNHRLSVGSPVVDAGDPAAGGPALDRDGGARVADGDADGTAVRDMGAYELSDTTAPETSITSGPSGATKDSTPTFGFSSEPGATFECRVDAAAFAACSGPGGAHTTATLADGSHTFEVRATDEVGNVEAEPAARSFVVDTVAPDTVLKGKPGKRVRAATVRFRFTSTPAGADFQCKLDQRRWRACSSPASVKVKVGRHRFAVRAVDQAGNVDGTPATYTFRRLPPR